MKKKNTEILKARLAHLEKTISDLVEERNKLFGLLVETARLVQQIGVASDTAVSAIMDFTAVDADAE